MPSRLGFLLTILLLLPLSCRGGRTGAGTFQVLPSETGNHGCLFQGPADLATATVDTVFGPNGNVGLVDGPLGDPATAISLAALAGAVADGVGDRVYLATGDPAIRVIDLNTLAIATLVSDLDFAAFDPMTTELSGLAIVDLTLMLVVDRSLNRILAIDRATGTLLPFAGVPSIAGGFADGDALTEAEFDFADGGSIAVSGSGRVFVADSGNHRVREIHKGKVSTLAGSGVQGFFDGSFESSLLDGPVALSIDCSGGLVFSELGQRLRRLGASTSIFGGNAITSVVGTGIQSSIDGLAAPNGSASVDDPVAPTVLLDGNLVWFDRGSATLRHLDRATNLVSSPIALPVALDSTFAMVVTRTDWILVFDPVNQAIHRLQ